MQPSRATTYNQTQMSEPHPVCQTGEREKVAPYLLGLEVVEDTVEDQLGGHQLITCVDLTRNPTLQRYS